MRSVIQNQNGFRWFSWVLGLLVSQLLIASVSAQDVTYATEVMKKFNLTKQGSFWVLPGEAEISKQVAALPALEKKFADDLKKYQDYIAKIKLANQQYELAIEEYKKIEPLVKGGNPPPAVVQRNNQLVTIINQLEPNMVRLDSQDVSKVYTDSLIAISKERNELTLAVVALKETLPKLEAEYAELKKNEEIIAALKILGPMGQKLGPVKSYKLDARKNAFYDKELFGPNYPLTRNGEHLVVYGIINEKHSFPFSWLADIEQTLLQSKDLAELGITPAADAPSGMLEIGEDKIKVTQIKVTIRFGQHVLRDVEALVMDAAGKDYGNIIGSKAMGELVMLREPKELNATIRNPNDPDPNAKKTPGKSK